MIVTLPKVTFFIGILGLLKINLTDLLEKHKAYLQENFEVYLFRLWDISFSKLIEHYV